MSILKDLQRAFREHDLIESGDSTLLVGVSGGVDSLVLLHGLVQLRDTMPITLVVATLDHRLRGEAGAADAAFVEKTAHGWGVPCERGGVDVASLAEDQGMSIEQAARHARYRFFAQVANRLGIRRVAVAHHADDQAETVLLHLVRGAGLNGLAGMRWSAPLPGDNRLTLIRPLLGVRRREIEAYAKDNGLFPRVDATNEDTTYTRNRVRHEILPMLRQINPNVDAALIRLANNAESDDTYLNDQLADRIRDQVVVDADRIVLPRQGFRALPSALQRRFVMWSAQRLKASQPDSADDTPVSHERALAAVEASLDGKVGTVIELGGGLNLRVDYEKLMVETDAASSPLPVDTPLIDQDSIIAVSVPGEVHFDGWRLCVKNAVPPEPVNIRIPQDSEVTIRTRRAGDQFRIGLKDGRVGTRQITRWMIDAKVPRMLRERIPLVIIDSKVAAVIWRRVVLSRDFNDTMDDNRKYLYHISLEIG